MIISTTLPPDLGRLRFQDAATDSNHSNQALGLQHSPPRSADEVHAAIEQFLPTDSTECVVEPTTLQQLVENDARF